MQAGFAVRQPPIAAFGARVSADVCQFVSLFFYAYSGDALKRNSTFAGRFALTALAAAVLGGASSSTWALGLGRLQVISALGEPLRAEIDITSLSSEESANLRLRVASPESYRAAGVEYNAVLAGSQVELRRRADGRPFLRLTNDRGIQEPFVDVILEINWATGKLVREYTLLFDPPTTARTSPPAVVAAAIAPSPATPADISAAPRITERRIASSAAASPPQDSSTAKATADTAVVRQANVSGKIAKQGNSSADGYRVKAGDSLSRIAARTQRVGVSLDQMLVSLYQANPHAFMDNNMNRLRSGSVLSIPIAQEAQAITADQARQVIQAQSVDFGAYRQRLATGLPATRNSEVSQRSSGNVQSSISDGQALPVADKLTLTKGAAPGPNPMAEESISKAREKKADEIRVAELSKNLIDLKRLSGATAAVASSPVVASNSATPASANVPALSGAASASLPPAIPAISVVPAVGSTTIQAAVASQPIAPVSGVSSKPIVTAAPASSVVPARAHSSRPAGLASLLDANPAALGLGGLVLALLAGFGIYKVAKRVRKDSGETSFLESRLQPDSFFGGSGGQRIDTLDASGASSSMSYSLSQLDAIGDVDPVAEADVYRAYGRDLQAEEILKEAMRSSPQRMAIRTKLLEVYAKRRDTKGFELLATQMFALTRGEGVDWVKAQEMGAQIDPDNSLYQPGGTPLVPIDGGEINEVLGASTMPQSVLPAASQFGDSVTAVLPGHHASLDRDLDLGLDLDLDLGDPGTGSPTAASQLVAPVDKSTSHVDARERPLSFDLSSFGVSPAVAGVTSELGSFDRAAISYDLDLPDTLPADPTGVSVFDDSELASPNMLEIAPEEALARQLELAEEFSQIGDADGARDLLQDVLTKSSGAVKLRAEQMLAALG